jgi:hypothetical protein
MAARRQSSLAAPPAPPAPSVGVSALQTSPGPVGGGCLVLVANMQTLRLAPSTLTAPTARGSVQAYPSSARQSEDSSHVSMQKLRCEGTDPLWFMQASTVDGDAPNTTQLASSGHLPASQSNTVQ